MRPVIVPLLTRFAGPRTMPEAVGFRCDRRACPGSSRWVNRSGALVEAQPTLLPDGEATLNWAVTHDWAGAPPRAPMPNRPSPTPT
jgi:hypothetical protein